jgi:hypothetical protein
MKGPPKGPKFRRLADHLGRLADEPDQEGDSHGATAVMIGHPALYGLAAAGQQGVEGVLEILRGEIEKTLADGRRATSTSSAPAGLLAPA